VRNWTLNCFEISENLFRIRFSKIQVTNLWQNLIFRWFETWIFWKQNFETNKISAVWNLGKIVTSKFELFSKSQKIYFRKSKFWTFKSFNPENFNFKFSKFEINLFPSFKPLKISNFNFSFRKLIFPKKFRKFRNSNFTQAPNPKNSKIQKSQRPLKE
jgi:hypothetical protein